MACLVVTGGFGTLGQAVARAAHAQGWQVAAVDVAPAPPPKLAQAGLSCFPGTDLLDEAATAVLFGDIDARMGGVTALVNVAGGFVWITADQAGADIWRGMHAMNVLTAASACRAALPALRRTGGSIVNIGASAALHAAAGMAPYAAAKSGVHRLTEALAAELRGSAVRVNAVLPSIIDTPANRADMPDADTAAWVRPEELADVILFLVSDAARAVNGALIPVTR